MSRDCLKLTTYSGERHRSGGTLVADAMLAHYGRHGVRCSVLLRGIEGYGPAGNLHTDRLLTLSEDLPIVTVAVDTRARIEALLPELLALPRHGLVTLERAQMVSGEEASGDVARSLGDQAKLTLYVGRQQRVGRRPAFLAICELLASAGIAGATVLLGVDGTMHGERRRARFLAANAEVPLMIIAVGDTPVIEAALPGVAALAPDALLTFERVVVCRRDGVGLASPPPVRDGDASGLPVWQKLMIYSSGQASHDGIPLHVALVRALAAAGINGATCLRGIWGFHGDHPPHGDRLLSMRRRVPVVTIVVDAPERIAAASEVVEAHTRTTGLVTCELVPTAATVREGRVHGELHLPPPRAGQPHTSS